jgi:chemotaxis protein MotB
MKKLIYMVVWLMSICMVLPSCVSKRKYYAARRANDELMKNNQSLEGQVSGQKSTIDMLTDSIGILRSSVATLSDIYQSTNSQLNLTKDQIAAHRARVKQLSDALVGFNANELIVNMHDGRVYVSMQESLLFPSGSAVVNARGKDALAKVAGVLNTNPDISINIEGHTDSVPIHNKKYSDNWDLSTARAVAIAHVLIDEYKVSPDHLIASGRSKYHPVADNSESGGRALNRRTEIILEPKLDELMQIMNAPAASISSK